MDDETREMIEEALTAIDALRARVEAIGMRSIRARKTVEETVRAACAWEADRARETAIAEERAACVALAEKVWTEHPLTVDRHHEPGCICDAIGRGACSDCDRGEAIIAALRARRTQSEPCPRCGGGAYALACPLCARGVR